MGCVMNDNCVCKATGVSSHGCLNYMRDNSAIISGQKLPKLTATSKGAGLKYDGGKPSWVLLMKGCAKALLGVVGVLDFGAKKYSADSWKQVENGESRYRDALYRHLNAIESGELIDPESGLSHWDHICTNALFLSELSKGK